MQQNKKTASPDPTAIRTALWRAMHAEVDDKPHIIEDQTGLALAAPDSNWRQRPDMHPEFTKRLRASVVARARYIEDLIIEQNKLGIGQYVALGAGLDTFAQRRADICSNLQVYEIDQPGMQHWKQQRLNELGLGIPAWLHFVSVDFETSSWWEPLSRSGFDQNKAAIISSTGVTLYLTKKAIASTLHQVAGLAPGSMLVMSFYLPLYLLDEVDKPLQQIAEKGAHQAGTPMISFFKPPEILALAEKAGLKQASIITTRDIERLYFSGRTDNLLPASGEVFLLAST